VAPVKLVDSVPGAPPVSTESINLKVGAAYKHGKRTIYYGTVPKRCPKGGFPAKLELTFASGETVTTNYKAPCPKTRR
jgi:predicted YcjX-like family ATPase